MTKFDFSTYISPFTWRYGSKEMRYIFSEQHKYELWRKIWVALAYGEYKAGLLTKQEYEDLKTNEKHIDIDRILEIEKETKHDVVAAIREFAEKAKIGGGKIHLGATSMDIDDNDDIMRIIEALQLVETKIITLLNLFSVLIEKYAAVPCLGFTHLQPAEPTTVGYRLAFYAQDLLNDLSFLQFVKSIIRTKGMKGAVGTAASYQLLLKDKTIDPVKLEEIVMDRLGVKAALITNQIYSRKYEFFVTAFLQSVTSTFAKFAGDVRILQSPTFGEWSEPFGKKQVGSSAMPFKKNPTASENICSLSRYVASLAPVTLENASLSYLERTLDDSANRRLVIPEAFLATDQILITAQKIISGLIINEKRIAYNLNLYAPFAATEAILMEAVKSGANRQEMHEVIRNISMIAWTAIQEGKPSPMEGLLMNSLVIKKYLNKEEVKKLLNVKNHIGDAPERARKLVEKLKIKIKELNKV